MHSLWLIGQFGILGAGYKLKILRDDDVFHFDSTSNYDPELGVGCYI